MAKPGFFNDNEYRDYPFITRPELPDAELADETTDTVSLPHSAIVDCGIIMGVEVPFAADAHKVYLHAVRRTGDTFEFEFRTDAPIAEDYALIFTRQLAAAEYATEHAEAIGITDSSSSLSGACPDGPVWEGYLVTGQLADLGEALEDGQEWDFSDTRWQLEPARMQVLSYLRSISLANYDRTHADLPDDCTGASSESAGDSRLLFVNSVCMLGNLKFKPGFNCAIRQEDTSNTIIISGAVGGGAGLPCNEIPLYEGEASPDDGSLLGGGPQCNEVITSINGIGGRDVSILAGSGVTIIPDELDPNGLLVSIDLHDLTACPDN